MYYKENGYIEVEMADGRKVSVLEDSPFYFSILNLIDCHEVTQSLMKNLNYRDANYTVEDWSFISNSVNRMNEEISGQIEERAKIYESLRRSNPLRFIDIKRGEYKNDFEQQELYVQRMYTQLKGLEDYIHSDNPVIVYNRVLDVNDELGKLNESEKSLNGKLTGIEERTYQEAMDELSETSETILGNYGIRRDSPFYSIAEDSLKTTIACDETTRNFKRKGVEVPETVTRIKDESMSALNDLVETTALYGGGNGLKTSSVNYARALSGVPIETGNFRRMQQVNYHINNGNMTEANNALTKVEQNSKRAGDVGNAIKETGQRETGKEKPGNKKYKPNIKRDTLIEKLKKNKKKIIIGAVAVAAGVALASGLKYVNDINHAGKILVTGMNIGRTINEIVLDTNLKNLQDGYGKIDYGVINNPIVQIDTEQTVQQPQVAVPNVENNNVISQQTYAGQSNQQEKLGLLESTVGKMSDEQVKYILQAFEEGNKNVPSRYYNAFNISVDDYGVNERDQLQKIFAECDERIKRVKNGTDTYQLSHQMCALMRGVAKWETAEAMRAIGVNVTPDDIIIDTSYNKNTCQNEKYDISYMSNGKKVLMTRKDHMNDTEFGKGMSASVRLEGAVRIINAFEQNGMMAQATIDCYETAFSYLSGQENLRKYTKSKGFEEINGERPVTNAQSIDEDNER